MRLMPNSFTKKLLALTLAGFSTTSCSLLEDYPQNPHIQETSSESYKKCDEPASDILQISYDNAGEKRPGNWQKQLPWHERLPGGGFLRSSDL